MDIACMYARGLGVPQNWGDGVYVVWSCCFGQRQRSAQSLGGVPRIFMALRPWTSGEIEYLKGGA